MADISRYLSEIMAAVYGEQVRGSIYNAIDIINKVGEKNITVGTAVTSTRSSISGYYKDSLYLNSQTWDMWRCTGNAWVKEGNLKGTTIASISKTGNTGNTDIYTVKGSDGSNLGTFNVSNGCKFGMGSSVTSVNTSTYVDGTYYYNNDIYVNTNTWIVWRCNGSGWENKGSIKGQTGPQGERGLQGEQGVQGVQGPKGDTGFSPTIDVVKNGKVATITITDVTGTETFTIRDGNDGTGTGDMVKATYDTDDDGVVDVAKRVADIDTSPTAGSNNPVKSGGLFNLIGSVSDLNPTANNLVEAINNAAASGGIPSDHVTITGTNAYAIGSYTRATATNQFVVGQYNDYNDDNHADSLFEVGCGTTVLKKANALQVLKDGSVHMNDLYVGGVKMVPAANFYIGRATVQNSSWSGTSFPETNTGLDISLSALNVDDQADFLSKYYLEAKVYATDRGNFSALIEAYMKSTDQTSIYISGVGIGTSSNKQLNVDIYAVPYINQ